jgi:hypothetical protein
MAVIRSDESRKGEMIKHYLVAALLFAVLAAPSSAATDQKDDDSGYRHVEMAKGNALVDPDRPTIVTTPYGDLLVKPSAQAFIMLSPTAIAIFNLNDRARGDIKFVHDGKGIATAPGQELVISKQPGDFHEVNPGKMIPFRSLTKHKLDDGATVYSAEYSVLSLVKAAKPLKAKLNSDKPKDRETIRTILKNGLMLSESNSHVGKFQFAGQQAKAKESKEKQK